MGPAEPRRDLRSRDTRATPRAVFLHTGWRSGGTWLWSKLRALEDVQAYYEPLHEHLGSLTASGLIQHSAESWVSGHGETPPYYLEYASLLKLRMFGEAHGVRNYRERFAAEDFFLTPGQDDPDLRRYLESLLSGAAYVERRPVLKFCRSLGRVAWMEQAFPEAFHVVLLRNPALQWRSSRAQFLQDGNRYFLVAPCLVLARNRHHPLVRTALARFGVPLPSLPEKHRQLDRELCWRHLAGLDWAARFRVFMAYWTVTAISSLSGGSALPVDMDRLSASAEYRSEIESALSHAGVAVSLESAHSPWRPDKIVDAGVVRAAHDMLDEAGQALSDESLSLIRRKLGMAPQDHTPARPVPGWTPPPPLPLAKRLLLAGYFVLIGVSMPLRRLHGQLRRARRSSARRVERSDAQMT